VGVGPAAFFLERLRQLKGVGLPKTHRLVFREIERVNEARGLGELRSELSLELLVHRLVIETQMEPGCRSDYLRSD
jgi:hypothetical protein